MDAAHTDFGIRFRSRLGHAFANVDTSLVLKAYDWVVARLDAGHLFEPIRAAELLLSQHADPITVTCALLMPLRRQGCLATDDVGRMFGEDIADLVEKAFSDCLLRVDTEEHRKEDLRQFLQSMETDIRTVILRLTFRLVELERLAGENGPGHGDIAQETLDLYVPLASRMGMRVLRTQLEDACFRLLEPLVYAEIERHIGPLQSEDDVCLELLKAGVRDMLDSNGIAAKVYARRKGLYSLYRKMQRLQRPLEEVMDKVGLRIIVSSVGECYAVLGLLHNRFRPVAGTFDDYISLPKENGYQSLHTCVYPVPEISHKPVEFQIRTEAMHREAEFGAAAHWLYKSQEELRIGSEQQLHWLRTLLSQCNQANSHAEFIDSLHRQVFDDRLVVFDEAGRPVRLPADATVKDFVARHLESQNAALTVWVNHVPRPMDHPLQDGDIVSWSRRTPSPR